MPKEKRIVVVGSHVQGLFMRVERIPTADETVLSWDYREALDGGKGSHQAIACARLGAPTSFVGRVGQDRLGDRGAGWMRDAGVDLRAREQLEGRLEQRDCLTIVARIELLDPLFEQRRGPRLRGRIHGAGPMLKGRAGRLGRGETATEHQHGARGDQGQPTRGATPGSPHRTIRSHTLHSALLPTSGPPHPGSLPRLMRPLGPQRSVLFMQSIQHSFRHPFRHLFRKETMESRRFQHRRSRPLDQPHPPDPPLKLQLDITRFATKETRRDSAATAYSLEFIGILQDFFGSALP